MSTNPQAGSESPAKIFISYRREDTQQIAGRLFDRLADTFGEEFVLKDVDSIPYGVDFREYSTRLVQESRIVLALIGPLWLQRRANGTRRIDDEADLVRLEIEASLRHCAVVIPVLVGDAEPPGAADLPASIAGLAYRNAARLRHDPDFRVDSDRLIRRLREILSEPLPTIARTSTLAVAQESSASSAPARATPSNASKPGREEATTLQAPSVVATAASSSPATSEREADSQEQRPQHASPGLLSKVALEPPSPAWSVASRQRQPDRASEASETTEVEGSRAKNVVPLRKTKVAILASAALALCLIGAVAIFAGPYFVPWKEEPPLKAEPDPDAGAHLPTSDHGSDAAGSIAYPPRYENIAELISPPGIPAAPMQGAGTYAGEVQAFGDPPIEFCWCPAGSFRMGSPADDPAADDHEKPQVDVTLTQGFWLGKTEVTQGQWSAVMGTTPWKTTVDDQSPESVDLAANRISWDEAQEFCRKLTQQERLAWRLPSEWEYVLPTEAQWEYACRAGTTTRYSFEGEDERLGDYAWYGEAVEGTYVHAVGSKLPNPWGLFDMHGNVQEWCRDSTDDPMHALPGGEDPYNDRGSSRVVRGGFWACHQWSLHCAERDVFEPSFLNPFTGFRVACVSSE